MLIIPPSSKDAGEYGAPWQPRLTGSAAGKSRIISGVVALVFDYRYAAAIGHHLVVRAVLSADESTREAVNPRFAVVFPGNKIPKCGPTPASRAPVTP